MCIYLDGYIGRMHLLIKPEKEKKKLSTTGCCTRTQWQQPRGHPWSYEYDTWTGRQDADGAIISTCPASS